MEVKVILHIITIKDDISGEVFSVKTLRTAKEIVGYIEESEKDEIGDRLENLVSEAYHHK